MLKSTILCIFVLTLTISVFIHAHNGHSADIDSLGWLTAIGRFHLLFLHFPIALIVMTVVAEWLWIWFANPVFNHAAHFMIIAAASFAIPTALLGLAFGYDQNYEGIALDLYAWHRYFGLVTTGLVIITAILRERHARKYSTSLASYYICLFFLFLTVSLTGAFGGSLTFGFDNLRFAFH